MTITVDNVVLWTAITAIATATLAVMNLLIFVAIHQGSRQIRLNVAAQDSEVLRWMFEEVESTRPLMAKLRTLGPYETWTPDERQDAWHIASVYQRISFFALNGMLTSKRLMAGQAGAILDAWYLLKPHVLELRKALGEPLYVTGKEGRLLNLTKKKGAFSRRHFEILAGQCEDYLSESFPVVLAGIYERTYVKRNR